MAWKGGGTPNESRSLLVFPLASGGAQSLAFLASTPLESAGIGLQGQMQLFRASGNQDTVLRAEGSEKADNRAVWLKSRGGWRLWRKSAPAWPFSSDSGTQS